MKLNTRNAKHAWSIAPILDCCRIILETLDVYELNALDNNTDGYASLLFHISIILQTDKSTHKWMFCVQSKFNEAFQFDAFHQ